MKCANVLWKHPARYVSVDLIKNAKVPIIKMKDALHNFEFDIAFNQMDGVAHLQEVSKLMAEYPESKYLIMVMK